MIESLEVPKPENPEAGQMREWENRLKSELAEQIKAKNAMVKSDSDNFILEVTTKDGYTRFVYEPEGDSEKPFKVYSYHDKTEFISADIDKLWSVSMSKRGVENQIKFIKQQADAINAAPTEGI